MNTSTASTTARLKAEQFRYKTLLIIILAFDALALGILIYLKAKPVLFVSVIPVAIALLPLQIRLQALKTALKNRTA